MVFFFEVLDLLGQFAWAFANLSPASNRRKFFACFWSARLLVLMSCGSIFSKHVAFFLKLDTCKSHAVMILGSTSKNIPLAFGGRLVIISLAKLPSSKVKTLITGFSTSDRAT